MLEISHLHAVGDAAFESPASRHSSDLTCDRPECHKGYFYRKYRRLF